MHCGPFSPASVVDARNMGEAQWYPAADAINSDDQRAQAFVSFPGSQWTGKIKATGPNPAVIGDADTVTQVTVNVERKARNSGGNPVDFRASLYVGGVLQADNQADAVNAWPTTDTVKSYTFAVNLTGAQVKAADFGFALAAVTTGAKYTNLLSIDSITFEFEYS